MSVSAAAAVINLRAAVVSRQVPQGKCLNFVWRMYGSLNSTGYAQGTLSTALTAWNGSRDKHTDRNIPIGAPVYFGVSPTRTDRNKYAGDVMIHVGGGILGGTDVNGASTGYMTIEARSRQIQRPYLGWCGDFGGREIEFGVLAATDSGRVVIGAPLTTRTENDMPLPLSYALVEGGQVKGYIEQGLTYRVASNFDRANAIAQLTGRGIPQIERVSEEPVVTAWKRDYEGLAALVSAAVKSPTK